MRINLSEIAKLLLIYIIGIVLLIMMWSCNPVKQVLADIEKVKVVRATTDPLFPCANDSLVFIHDSTTVVETEYLRDTLVEQRNDTTFVNYFDTAVVTKTVTVTKEITVLDGRELGKLNDSLIAVGLREAAFKGQQLEKDKQIREAKKSKQTWFIVSLFLVVLLLIIGVMTIYKALTNILPIRK